MRSGTFTSKRGQQKEEIKIGATTWLSQIISWFMWAGFITLGTTMMQYHRFGYWFYFGAILAIVTVLRVVSVAWRGR